MVQYKGKIKQKKVKKVIEGPRSGSRNGEDVTVAHNGATDRYDLKVADRLSYSSVSFATCLKAAEDMGAKWS